MTKNEVIEGALSLNGDYKDYVVTTEGDKIVIEAKYNSRAIHNRTAIFRCVAHLNDDNTYTEVHYDNDGRYAYYGKAVGMQKSVSFSFGKKSLDSSIVKEEFNSEKIKKVLRDYLESCGYKRTNKGFFKRLFGK